MSKFTLRCLLLFWWLLLIVCVVSTLTTQQHLPPALAEYVSAQANAELSQFELAMIIFGLLGLLAMIVGSVGLFFFRTWGRETFVITNIIGVFLPPFFGPVVMSEATMTISYLCSILTGGLLFSVYLPPLRNLFVENRAANQ